MGNARLANAATSQEAWPEVAPKTTKVPLARAAVERRQSCAPRKGRGRARKARHNTHCVCRRFASEFLSFVAFPLPDPPPLAGKGTVGGICEAGFKRRTNAGTTPALFSAQPLRASRDDFLQNSGADAPRERNRLPRSVSRTRCSGISAFTRVFNALCRCTADPGSFNTLSLQRSRFSSASFHAALRPGYKDMRD